jgi:hypothetical protein
MRHTSICLLALAAAACLLAGCSTPSNNSASTTPTTPSLTGNWYFTTLYPGNIPQNIIYSGALSQSGANVTAVLHNSCFSNQDVDFTGTEDASGNLTLTSNNLPGNVVAIKGTITATGGVIQTSSYAFTVTGATPCAPLTASLTGSQIPSFTGNFAGNINSTTGAAANFTVALTQGTANTDGQFPLTGTVTVSSSACSVTFPFTIFFSGSGFTANLTSSTGPASTAVFTATSVISGSPSFLSNVNVAITGCNAGNFTGSLNKQ